MPTPTYDLLASTTLTSTAATVTFASINQSYGDLVLVADYTMGGDAFLFGVVQFNGDTGSNYPWVIARASTFNAASFTNTASFVYLNASITASVSEKTLAILQIMDYSATNKHKSVLARGNRPGGFTEMVASRWANTAAINSILITGLQNTYSAGSTFNLYGIAK